MARSLGGFPLVLPGATTVWALAALAACATAACATGTGQAAGGGDVEPGTGGHTAAGSGGSAPATGGGPATTGAGGDGGGGAGLAAQACPSGAFVVGVDDDGLLICRPVQADLQAALDAGCAIHAGWRDSCTGCTAAPSRWGRVDGQTCDPGVGNTNTCATTTLGAASVSLFGLNTGGDVDDNDKLYFGFGCSAPAASPAPGPCADGEAAIGIAPDGSTQCQALAPTATGWVAEHCELHVGWRDSCGSCGLVPTRWGRVGDQTCQNGLGTTNTCTNASLGGEGVQLFGLNPGGDVNDDDKFYFGLHCAPPVAGTTSADETCPDGSYVTGVDEAGKLICDALAPVVASVFEQQCNLYLGWRDSCTGCTTAPSRWGRVRSGGCDNGLGSTNTCTTATLGTATLHLFGLNTGGDVNDDDKFHFGWSCQ